MSSEIRLAGKTLCVLTDPPGLGAEVTLCVKLHVVEDCTAVHEDDTEVNYLKCRLVAAWREGSPPPPDDQGALWETAPPEGTFSHA